MRVFNLVARRRVASEVRNATRHVSFTLIVLCDDSEGSSSHQTSRLTRTGVLCVGSWHSALPPLLGHPECSFSQYRYGDLMDAPHMPSIKCDLVPGMLRNSRVLVTSKAGVLRKILSHRSFASALVAENGLPSRLGPSVSDDKHNMSNILLW